MKVFTWPRRHAVYAALVAVLTILASLSLAIVSDSQAAAAPASNDGFVRLAHLSPDTPAVDVYLDALSSKMKEQVFPAVAYGTVSGYLTLPPGSYSVSMRLAGAPRTSPVILTTKVAVEPGHAYTVAGVGRHADISLKVIPDDLSNPLDGQAMVRVVQASIKAPLLDVSIEGGGTVATSVPFATTTAYRSVAAGVLTLDVGATGSKTTVPLKVTLSPDCVYSILVLDGKTTLTAQLRTDAESKGAVPKGGVRTGGGGLASRQIYTTSAYVALGALLLTLILGIRRGPRSVWARRRTLSRRARRQPSRSL